MSNVIMLIIIFAVVFSIGLVGYGASYTHGGSTIETVFIFMLAVGIGGFIFCFGWGVVLLIKSFITGG